MTILERIQKLNKLQKELLGNSPIEEKFRKVTDGVVEIFGAEFCRLWIIRDGDLCDSDCIHSSIKEGPDVCVNRNRCLHLIVSSGLYTHINGDHKRVPIGAYKIGRIPTGKTNKFLTNDVANDPRIHNQKWAGELGLVSFAGYKLQDISGKTVGVLALFAKYPIDSENDALLEGLAGFVAQLTQLDNAEKKIRKLSTAVAQSSSVIMITNTNGNIEYVNPKFESVTGYSSSEVIGKNPRILYSGKTPQDIYTNMWKTITSGKEWRGEIHNIKKNGESYWASISISPIRNEEGKIDTFLAIQEDITRRKKMEKMIRKSYQKMKIKVGERTRELLKSNKNLQLEISERKRAEKHKERLLESLKRAQKMEAIGTLAGGIAHDFNNILTPIIGHTEILIRKAGEDNKSHDSLNQILKSAHRAKDLVKHIFNFSRQTKQEFITVSLSQTVKEVINLIRATLPSTLEVCENIDENTGVVNADITQMHQMIMNLCINAEHAMREKGGILEVNLESFHVDANFAAAHPCLKEGHYLKLTIRDTGHGINKEIIERIFDPFFTTKGVGEGTGMGLATVHGIVSSHGGEIVVKSEPGKGTTFDIYIPKAMKNFTHKRDRDLPVPKGSERILFVDDEKDIAMLGQKLLMDLGYEVVSKTNSLEALETFKVDPQRFDLVITDQTMPNMSGDVLAKEIMKIRPEIPVILCTGFSHKIVAEKAKAMGIREFIMKPFVAHEIASKIRRVLDQEKK